MADNITLNSGSGGDTMAADDISGTKYPRVKICVGADGVAEDVSNAAPVPISDAGGSVTVDGAVDAAQSGNWYTTRMVDESDPGLVPFRAISAASTNAQNVKADPGCLHALYVANAHATNFRYLKLYDDDGTPTVGGDTPVWTIAIPPMWAGDISLPAPLIFSVGIALAITTGMADSDTGATGANEVCVAGAYL